MLDGDGLELGGGTDWVGGLEDGFELFKSTADSFDAKQVPEDGLADIPSDEDEDIVVLDVLESDGAGVQVDEGEQADDDTIHTHTLGTGFRSQALDGVKSLERSVGEGVDDVEEEVGGESTLTNFEVGDTYAGVLGPFGTETTVDGQHDSADECTDDEDLAARHAVCKSHTSQGTDAGSDRVNQVEDELHVGIVSDGLVDAQVEVTETVTGELTEDTHEDDHQETPAGSVGLDESGVVIPALVRGIELDGILEFLPFQFDDGVVLDSVSVVLGQESLGLGIATIGKEPARGFGEEPDGENNNTGWETLEDEGQAPLKVAVDLLGTESDGGGWDGSSEPTAVVESGKTSTPLRGSNFDDVRGGGASKDGDTETENETTSNELILGICGRDDGRTNANDNSSDEHASTTSETISEGAGEPGTDDTSDGVDGEDDRGTLSEIVSCDEAILVVLHTVDGSHQRAIVAVCARAQESDEAANVEDDGLL